MIVIQHFGRGVIRTIHIPHGGGVGRRVAFGHVGTRIWVVGLQHMSVWHWWIKVLISHCQSSSRHLAHGSRSLSRTWWSSRCHDGVRGRLSDCWGLFFLFVLFCLRCISDSHLGSVTRYAEQSSFVLHIRVSFGGFGREGSTVIVGTESQDAEQGHHVDELQAGHSRRWRGN